LLRSPGEKKLRKLRRSDEDCYLSGSHMYESLCQSKYWLFFTGILTSAGTDVILVIKL